MGEGGVTAFTGRAVAPVTGFEPRSGAVVDRGVVVLRGSAFNLCAELRALRAAVAGAVFILFARKGDKGGTV